MIVEIRPGEGGDDAAAFAKEITEALTAYAQRNRWRALPAVNPDSRMFTLEMTGKNLDPLMQFAGTHRIQRVPANDKHGRRQTSTATVVIIEKTVTQTAVLNPKDLRTDFFRGSGPGGQHRNKTSTAVRLTHLPSGIVITRTSGRSQSANLQDAKNELIGRLTDNTSLATEQHLKHKRRTQTGGGDRPAKSFTHNTQRDQVLCHRTGQTWTMKEFAQGRLN